MNTQSTETTSPPPIVNGNNEVTFPTGGLPFPRLELRQRENASKLRGEPRYIYTYVLVLSPPLRTDMRSNLGDKYMAKQVEYVLNVSSSNDYIEDEVLPDRIHMSWDSMNLMIPAYLVNEMSGVAKPI